MLNSKKIIAVAEPSYIIRKGLVYVLSQFSFISKVIELREHDDIATQLDKIKPDAVVVNPMLLGHRAKQNLRQRLSLPEDTSVIALVYNLIDEKFYNSYDAVIKINDSESEMEKILSKCLTESIKPTNDQTDLSEREKEILVGIVKGMSNKEIGEFLNISIHTVITHRRNIGKKLEIHSVSGLTIFAIINKLVDIKEIEL